MDKKHFASSWALLGTFLFTALVNAEQPPGATVVQPMLPAAPARKHEAIEIKDTAEITKILFETLHRTVPAAERAAVFVADVAEGYRIARAAGAVGSFGSKALSKISPAGPFAIAWFASDAGLAVVRERGNMRVAGETADEAINRLGYLMRLHAGGEIKFNGKTFRAEEVIPRLRELRQELTREQGTNWGVLKEIGRSVVPWLHNTTADEANSSAAALLLLAHAVREATAAIAIEVEEQLKKDYQSEGDQTVASFMQGLSCNLYVTCLTGDPQRRESFGNWKKVNLPMAATFRDDDPDVKNKRLRVVSSVLQTADTRRTNFGCSKDEESGKVHRYTDLDNTVRFVENTTLRGTDFNSRPMPQVTRECRDVPGWTGMVYVHGSTYQSNGFETAPQPNNRQWVMDYATFHLAVLKSNPETAATMASSTVRPAFPLNYDHTPQPPRMTAR